MPSAVGRSPAALPGRVVPPSAPPLQGVLFHTQWDSGETLASWFDNQVGSTASLDTSVFHSGTTSFKCHQTGTASGSIKNFPSKPRVLVGRLWFQISSLPSATWQLCNCDIGGGANTIIIRITTTGKLGILFNGGTAQTSTGTIATGTWTSLDFRLDTRDPVTWKLDAILNGTETLTQATFPAPAAGSDIDNLKMFSSGAITNDGWVDDIQYADDWGMYPLQDIPAPTGGTVTSGPLDVTGSGSITVAQPLYTAFSGALDATGAAAITVAASSIVALSGALDVTGAASITVAGSLVVISSGPLDVTGAASITVAASTVIKASGPLDVTGVGAITVAATHTTAFSGPLAVTGAASATVGASHVTSFSGPLDATGAASITVAASHVSGSGTTLSGPLDVTGNAHIDVNVPRLITTRTSDLDFDPILRRLHRW